MTIEAFLTRSWEMLVGRNDGPMAFRLVLQPTMAAILARPPGGALSHLGPRRGVRGGAERRVVRFGGALAIRVARLRMQDGDVRTCPATGASPTLPPSGGEGASGVLLVRWRGPEGCMTYEWRYRSRLRMSTMLRWVGSMSDRTVRANGFFEPGGAG